MANYKKYKIKFDNEKIEKAIQVGKLIPFEKIMEETKSTPKRWQEFLRNAKELDEENEKYIRERLAKKIKRARLKSQVTQEELARRLNTKKSYISLIESGKQNISVEYLVKVAKVLNRQVRVDIY